MNTPTTHDSVPAVSDFRAYLVRELSIRIRTNPSYSLRAFARDLDVDPSYLSKVLRGKKPVTISFLEDAGIRLELSPQESHRFRLSVQTQIQGAPQAYLQLSQDTFEIVADWRNYALLELLKLREFQTDPHWIAKKLQISLHEVHDCMDRLKRSGLLKINSDGTWTDTSEGFSTHILGDNTTSIAHRKAQREILAMASQALDEVPIQRRDQSSMMMATSFQKIQKAKEMIRDFRRHLTAFLEEGTDKDCVFQLSVSLFPITESDSEIQTNRLKENSK